QGRARDSSEAERARRSGARREQSPDRRRVAHRKGSAVAAPVLQGARDAGGGRSRRRDVAFGGGSARAPLGKAREAHEKGVGSSYAEALSRVRGGARRRGARAISGSRG